MLEMDQLWPSYANSDSVTVFWDEMNKNGFPII